MLHTVTCTTCETHFEMPKNIFVLMQENHIPIHCPMGHAQTTNKKEENLPQLAPTPTGRPPLWSDHTLCPICNTSIEQKHFHEHIVLHIKGRPKAEFTTPKRIKIIRAYYGLSQRKLAENLRLRNQSQVSYAERDLPIPSIAYSVLKSWVDDNFEALIEEAEKI